MRIRPRLTYANVIATLALFVALGGASYAAVTLPRDSVGSGQVRDGSLRLRDLALRQVNFTVNVRVKTADVQGKVLIFASDLLGPSGRKVGEQQGYCVETIPQKSRTCTETYALKRGELHIVGTTGLGRGAVIVGGTGIYQGAVGRLVPGPPANGLFPNHFELVLQQR